MPRFCPERPLPPYAHQPGVTAHPLRDPAGHGIGGSAAPAPFAEELWLLVDDCRYALDLFHAGFYWEAHELWEGLWKAAVEPRQQELFKGLAQVAAALLHRRDGRDEAAATLAGRADRHLATARAVLAGVDTARLRRELAAAVRGGPAPRIVDAPRSRDRAGLATERWVLAPILESEERDGCLVLRTPAQPDFYDGHGLVLDRAPEPERIGDWLERCRAWVGGIGRARQQLVWEDDAPHCHAPLPAGVRRDEHVVLSTRQPGAPMPVPAGLRVAVADGDEHWRGAAALGHAVCVEAGVTGNVAGFVRARYEFLRQRTAGEGRFWVAVDERGEVAGSLGLVVGPLVFRFQDVQVRADQRGRGLATAMMSCALAEAFARHPGAVAVLVAESGSQAERIYRRLGFSTASHQHWLRRHAP